MKVFYEISPCSLGFVLAAFTKKGVLAVLLGDSPDLLVTQLKDCFPTIFIGNEVRKHTRQFKKIVDLVEHPYKRVDFPLDLRGTDFQKQVWQEIMKVPPGQTRTYADIAANIGKPQAVRAVAQACGKNRLAVLVPCHRIVKKDGTIGGYYWQIERKERLIAREKCSLKIMRIK